MNPLNDELQRWLDGELHEADLSPETRAEARFWRAVLDAAEAEVGPAPPWIEHAVMRGLPEERPSALRRAFDWALRRRTLRIRPVTATALAAAALAALLLWPDDPTSRQPLEPVRAASGPTADGRVYVQFVYVAPAATAVSVAGDFNGWSESATSLRDPDGDGVWSGYVSLSPGLHKYMFVVDGEWMTDPRAERYVDDGFGNRNALISIAPTGSEI